MNFARSDAILIIKIYQPNAVFQYHARAKIDYKNNFTLSFCNFFDHIKSFQYKNRWLLPIHATTGSNGNFLFHGVKK